jgi:hypothetical protein
LEGVVTNKPPKITFAENEPLQDYYRDNKGNMYSVARIIDAAKDLKPFDCPLAALDLSHEIWEDCDMFMLAFHCLKLQHADLSKPIILDWRGGVADGRHRIIKAIMMGKPTIKAVRLTWRLDPCKPAQD